MRILFVAGYCIDVDNADEIVNNEITSALQKMPGVEVQVTGRVLKGQQPSVDWKRNPLFMFRKILHWPAIDPDAVAKCYNQICLDLKRTSYDAIIAAHKPYDAVLAAMQAKKKYPDVQLMIYELDPLNYVIDKYRRTLARHLYFLRLFAEKRAYNACDTIIHMENTKDVYSKARYDKYKEKSIYLGLPLVHNKGLREKPAEIYSGQLLRLIYAGKLMSNYRSPDYLFKVLIMLHDRLNIEAFFYTGGDCEELLSEYASKYSYFHQKGYVDKATLDVEMSACDCLLNIGNQISAMLPSKLMSYIESGMPIIHVQKQEKDICVDYVDRYKLAVIIKETDPVERSVEKVEDFLRKNYGRRLGSDYITSEFTSNTPEYSAEMIVNSIYSEIEKVDGNGDR